MSIVFAFSWDHRKSQDRLETMLMQNLGGQTKSIMVFSEVAYYCYECWTLNKVALKDRESEQNGRIKMRERQHLSPQSLLVFNQTQAGAYYHAPFIWQLFFLKPS